MVPLRSHYNAFDSSLTLWENLNHVWSVKDTHVTLLELKSLQTPLWISTNIDGNSECFQNAVNQTIPACPIPSGKISCPFGCELAKIRQACAINYQRHSKWEKTSTACKGYTKVCNKGFICQITLEHWLQDMQEKQEIWPVFKHSLHDIFCWSFSDFLTLLLFNSDTKYSFHK